METDAGWRGGRRSVHERRPLHASAVEKCKRPRTIALCSRARAVGGDGALQRTGETRVRVEGSTPRRLRPLVWHGDKVAFHGCGSQP